MNLLISPLSPPAYAPNHPNQNGESAKYVFCFAPVLEWIVRINAYACGSFRFRASIPFTLRAVFGRPNWLSCQFVLVLLWARKEEHTFRIGTLYGLDSANPFHFQVIKP